MRGRDLLDVVRMAGQLMVVSASPTAALRNSVDNTSHSSKAVAAAVQPTSRRSGRDRGISGGMAGWLGLDSDRQRHDAEVLIGREGADAEVGVQGVRCL